MEREHIISILRRYLTGELSEHDVEEWANAFEPRSDVAFGAHYDKEITTADEKIIRNAIYILANPALEGTLTQKGARWLIAQLEQHDSQIKDGSR